MSVVLILLLALSPNFVFTYNVDTSHPIVFTDPSSERSSYFGYSVALGLRKNSATAFNLFIGAPRFSDDAEGSVYRCTETRTGSEGTACRRLEIDRIHAQKKLSYYSRLGRYDVYVKSGWLGASMAIGASSELRVCAPRTLIITVVHDHPIDGTTLDMRGVCYDFDETLGDTLIRDNGILTTFASKLNLYNINLQYGFSLNYVTNKGLDKFDRITGQPRINNVQIKHRNITTPHFFNKIGWANLGYSVASGYFLKPGQLIFAAGAPAWNARGMVLTLDMTSTKSIKITGPVFGEYFGASLASGDFNGDGLDDLAVGAPHWGDVDVGRVYTYYGNDGRKFEEGVRLQGTTGYGQFGYTLASADLNRDGYSDLIVSAPWEASGVVYVFYGHSEFGTKDSSVPLIQKIESSGFDVKVQRFGFALSHPVDIDNNGYPDLAIGAYKSGHAFVLRGRPVIQTQVSLSSDPNTLEKSTRIFVVNVCVLYNGRGVQDTQELWFDMTVDKDHKRASEGSLQVFETLFQRAKLSCTKRTIALVNDISNTVDPIVIQVKLRIKEGTAGNHFCSSCPVLTENSKDSVGLEVPFNTGCKNRTVCNADLSVIASFGGNSKDNRWVFGSGDISLNLVVKNDGEPAYSTELVIEIPPGIRLRNGIRFCTEDTKNNALTLVCKIDNPLVKGEDKNLNIGLDMGNLVQSASRTVLTFNITRSTRAVDHGHNNPLRLNLKILNVAYITLTGMADKESQDYGRPEERSVVPIRHTYRVLRSGPTPIDEAHLFIAVPIAVTGRDDSFLNITVPKLIDSSGNTYECSIINAENSPWTSDAMESGNGIFQRRRRRDAGNSEETEATFSTPVTDEDETEEKEEGKEESANENRVIVDGQYTDRLIYLNCSTDGVLCATYKCEFSLRKSSEDVGNVALDIVFNANAFHNLNEDSLNIKYDTNASVKIIWPFIEDRTYIRNTTAGASTILFNVPEPQKLAGWILPSSIVFGILLFCILTIILFKVGFFKRPKKVETAKAKEMEMILKCDDGASENNS